MDLENSEAEEGNTGFASDVAEFDEIDNADTALEMQLLAARVQAARHCGA